MPQRPRTLQRLKTPQRPGMPLGLRTLQRPRTPLRLKSLLKTTHLVLKTIVLLQRQLFMPQIVEKKICELRRKRRTFKNSVLSCLCVLINNVAVDASFRLISRNQFKFLFNCILLHLSLYPKNFAIFSNSLHNHFKILQYSRKFYYKKDNFQKLNKYFANVLENGWRDVFQNLSEILT